MKPRKDEDAKVIEAAKSASYFMVSIFVGTGRFDKYRAKSLAHARAGGEILERRLNNGRQSMVYAIDAIGGSTFVPRRLDDQITAA